MSTGIEWTDVTWNCVRGCSRVSAGCERCYAERTAGRFSGPGQPYEGLVRPTPTGPRWTGEVRLVPERLADPLRWRKPRRVFVNSMSDLFHEKLSDAAIAAVFGVMAAAPRHTFQVLTKRPARMAEWFGWVGRTAESMRGVFPHDEAGWLARHIVTNRARHFGAPSSVQPAGDEWPLPNVWLGVSVEDQATADARIPLLLETPAAIRFVSYEPALGPVDFTRLQLVAEEPPHGPGVWLDALRGHIIGPDDVLPSRLDWVIGGSESGPSARPAELDWFRRVRDDCAAAGVAFFLKQWVGDGALREPGSLGPGVMRPTLHRRGGVVSLPVLDDRQHREWPR